MALANTNDVREQLAKLEAEEKAAAEALQRLAEENRATKEKLLAELRDADLVDVREKCKLHGFTATDLRGFLKTKGGGKKTAASKSAARKSTTRKAS